MRTKFWGTRGSLPVALTAEIVRQKLIKGFNAAIGTKLDTPELINDFVSNKLSFDISGTFGGNSSSIQIDTGESEFVFLDMGSGAKPAGLEALKASSGKGRYHIFLSHLHWDHIMGFPFFVPAYLPGNRITIYGGHDALCESFATQQSPPFFPVNFNLLGADIDFIQLEPGRSYNVAGMNVSIMKQFHGGDSYGYRFEKCGKCFVYATDAEHKPDDAEHLKEIVAFFKDADAVVFDAMYSLADALSSREIWGHSSNMVGVELCHKAGAKRLCLFHHDPALSDEALFQIHNETRRLEEIIREGTPLEIITAFDGLELQL